MNKKGFTVVEVIVSFALISIILTSLVTLSISYRQRVEKERIKTELIDYKNTITKVIYDDILNNRFTKIEYCVNNRKCINFVDYNGIKHELNYVDNKYLSYDNINYLLPDNSLIKNDFDLKNSMDIYNLTFKIKNEEINYEEKIMLTIN